MRCLVLHPDLRGRGPSRDGEAALAEAISLAEALDLDVADARVVPAPKARAGTLFGSGKLAEIAAMVEEAGVGLVIVDGPLSPVQQRNLEKEWKAKVLDRTGLILEIFGERARTREGELQVELAHLTYQKSRLVRSWTHLERQRGGLGFVGGPGETQIEADRRALTERITRLKRELAKVAKTRGLHRAARARVPYPVVALVGYTNAGKSTLFNRLTGAEVLARDMLFATLDPTMRAVELPSGQRVILSDTVGFISDLPTQLVAAFRATLEEVLDADLILHVRDIAHPETEMQAENVRGVLSELGVDPDDEDRIREIWNKVDLLPSEEARAVAHAAARAPRVTAVSALTGQGIDRLLAGVAADLSPPVREETLRLRHDQGRIRAWLFERKLVVDERRTDEGLELCVRWSDQDRARFNRLPAAPQAPS
jgi:GTPase